MTAHKETAERLYKELLRCTNRQEGLERIEQALKSVSERVRETAIVEAASIAAGYRDGFEIEKKILSLLDTGKK